MPEEGGGGGGGGGRRLQRPRGHFRRRRHLAPMTPFKPFKRFQLENVYVV